AARRGTPTRDKLIAQPMPATSMTNSPLAERFMSGSATPWWQLLTVCLALAGTLTSAGAQPSPTVKSGYALSGGRCGAVPLAFPKLPIGMRPGYCAGLVASEDDGLVFPRSIVQVPDTRFFVVADMGGWSAGLGRLLLLDPEAADGKRIKVLLTKLDLP